MRPDLIDRIAEKQAQESWEDDLNGLQSKTQHFRDEPRQCDVDALYLELPEVDPKFERYFRAKFRQLTRNELVRRLRNGELPQDIHDSLVEELKTFVKQRNPHE